MIVLGIETSCDETALAIYDTNKGLLGHLLNSQIHQLIKYGGVIPEVAARYHIKYLTPLLIQLLAEVKISLSEIEFIAYTKGPGLVGSLLTGVSFAKTLSFALKIPCLGINHLEGHLLSYFVEKATNTQQQNIEKPTFPFLVLLASGGHTMLIKADAIGNYYTLGETLDDAAGEALDKTAKLLKLTPPNGKKLSTLAEKSSHNTRFYFPRPLVNSNQCNFSFSGLKTAAMLKIKELNKDNEQENYKADLAFAFQEAVMDTLVTKCRQAIQKTQLNQLVIAGGVSANKTLRKKLLELETLTNIKVFFPQLEFCTDNAAMIAYVGAIRASQGYKDQDLEIEALARWELNQL